MIRPALPLARASRATALSTVARRGYASHGPTYNEPSGRLFGEEPVPAGGKRKWQDWETIYYVGMFGGMAFAAVVLTHKPNTSIQAWALEEARARMEAEGRKVEYKPSKPIV